MRSENLAIVILAAGIGKRMRSKLAKVLHPLCGRPMLCYTLDLAKAISPRAIVVVVGRQKSRIEKIYKSEPVGFVYQGEQLGTGHATLAAEPHLKDFEGDLLVLSADVPLLRLPTLEGLLTCHRSEGAGVTILTAILENPAGYGRIVRNKGEVLAIVEEKDASAQVQSIREINTGIYVFQSFPLWTALAQIQPANVQGEYYLTDAIEIIRKGGGSVKGLAVRDPEEALGINTRESLAEARRILQYRIHRQHMLKGVTIVDPLTTEIDWGVSIGKDAVIHPFSSLKGDTRIGRGCEVGPHALIVNSEIGEGVRIGPFVHLDRSHLSGEMKS